jgi:hypothetical protein
MSKNKKVLLVALGFSILLALIISQHLKRMGYDGFCTQCRNCSHPSGQVFPYTQYQCCECGHIDLGK